MKNYTLNFLKFIASLLVVSIHCKFPEPIGDIILSIARTAVPIFFIISGYYSYNNNSEKIKKKIKNIFNITISANIFYLIYKIITVKSINIINIKQLMYFIILNDNPFRTHLWFLSALLYCYIIYLYTYKIINKKIFKIYPIISILTILLINIFFSNKILYNEFYYRNFIFIGLTFFLIGHKLNEFKIDKITNKKMIMFSLISVFLILIESNFYYSELYVGNVLLAIILFTLCQKNNKFIENRKLNYLGEKVSLYIYIFHPFIKDIIIYLYNIMNIKTNYLQTIITMIFSIIISIIIDVIIKKRKNYVFKIT